MGPLEGYGFREVELLEQVLDEGAYGINAAVGGVQPESGVLLDDIGLDLEAPVFVVFAEFGGIIGGHIVALREVKTDAGRVAVFSDTD